MSQKRYLGDLVDFVNGDRSANYPSASDYIEGGIPFISATEIDSGRIDLTKCKRISREAFDRLRSGKVIKGDTLYCLRGTLGKIGRVSDFDEGAIASSLAIVRAKPDVSADFIYYFLASPEGQTAAIALNNGSAQPNISVKALSRLVLDCPPLPEQRAIAATLGALDDKIELNRKMNATLEAMARALFRDWFVDFGPTRAKMEARAPYLSADLWSLFPDRLDDEGKPEGWEVGTMSDLFTLQRGFDLPSQDRRDGTYPILAASGPSGFHESYMVKGPGVTTGRSGVLGRVFYVHEDFWPLNTSLWIKDYKRATPLYAFQFLSLIDLAGFNAGSAVPTLNRNHVHGLPTVLPPREAVLAFDSIADSLMQRHRQNETENKTLARTRDLLLPRLMSGELRVAQVERLVSEVA